MKTSSVPTAPHMFTPGQTASSASFAFTSGFPAFDAFDEFDDEKLSGFEVLSVEASSKILTRIASLTDHVGFHCLQFVCIKTIN